VEIRDPVHQFVFISPAEAEILDTRPLQRLRAIHQLSTTHLVYPGATHTRFEHAIGTMELAGRAFDAVVHNSSQELKAELGLDHPTAIERARRLVRLGGLLHDAGHTPFSHSAEELFPVVDGQRFDHEKMTQKILSEDMDIAAILGPDLDDVSATAVGPKYAAIENPLLAILTSLVTGVLGVDRMDYLLRDCLYTGVSYGTFDIHRILATIKLSRDQAGGVAIALRQDGNHVAEQMLLARWHMFHQVYFEASRRIFDYHLTRYFRHWLWSHTYPGGHLPMDVGSYLGINDNIILADMYTSNHPDARALVRREHLRCVWEFGENDFASEDEYEQLQSALRKAHPLMHFDSVPTTLTKSGDGEVWIELSDGSVRPLEEASVIVQTLKSTRVRRAYAPLSQRDVCKTSVKEELARLKYPWFDGVYGGGAQNG
jgi:HD superfamily phosphohydrolase